MIREALANAAMHRNYLVHSPTQIIRYSNRIEIRNVGYSLKEPSQLGIPGSRLRNPTIAAVLHDLHLAEAKGTGIRAMRRLAGDAGLPLPEINSDRQANEFKLTLFLHNLLTEDDHAWLRHYAGTVVGADEAKVLLYARATGAVDNSACRDFCGLDTLSASLVLRRLRDRGLLEKQGAGNRTYYILSGSDSRQASNNAQPELPLGNHTSSVDDVGISGNHHKLDVKYTQALVGIPEELRLQIQNARKKPRKAVVRALLQDLCSLRPYTAQELCLILGRSNPRELSRLHLKPMRELGVLSLQYPESEKHPHQAYRTTDCDAQGAPKA